jgi:predicted RNA-binding protein with PUA-like domain
MNYWFFIARPEEFNFINDQGVGEIERWDALTTNIHRPKIRAYFRKVRTGDKVIGYNSGEISAVVATAVIERELYKADNGIPSIDLRKTKDLINSIYIDRIRNISPFFNHKFRRVALNTTVIPIEEYEYRMILELGNNIAVEYEDENETINSMYNAAFIAPAPVGPLQCPEPTISFTRKYPRNPAYSLEALMNSGFRCELENSHTTFTSKFNGRNFVEAHHLVPMNAQDKYKSIRLDVPGNIIALCPNCHRLIHLGEREIRNEKINELYTKRKQILTDWGIKITRKKLMNLYSNDENLDPLE